MMYRGFILLLLIALMIWLAVRVRRDNQILATALFTAGIAMLLLFIGGFFGWIGG